MNLSKILGFMLFVACTLILNGCEDSGTDAIICTDEFATITLEIQNQEGEAVEGVDITVTHAQSGDIVKVCESYECGDGTNGRYVIYHDGFLEETSMEGESFQVSGEKDGASFSEDFVFARNQCHVFKESGPNTVTIE